MGKYIVTFSDSIGEIEVNGFVVMTDKEIENFEVLASSITWPFSYKLGEESLEYNNGDELLERLDYKEITPEEGKMIDRLFNDEFGVFIDSGFLETIVEEEDEDYDDDDEDDEFGSYDDEYNDDDDY